MSCSKKKLKTAYISGVLCCENIPVLYINSDTLIIKLYIFTSLCTLEIPIHTNNNVKNVILRDEVDNTVTLAQI